MKKEYNALEISCYKENLIIKDFLEKINLNKIPYPYTAEIRSPKEQSKIIELLFLRIPLREIYIVNNNFTKNTFYLTNKENLEDIMDFVENSFVLEGMEIFPEYNNKKYSELPFFMQRRIIESMITVNTITSLFSMSNEILEDYLKQISN